MRLAALMRLAAGATTLVVVLTVAGCGGSPGRHLGARRATGVAVAQAAHEYPSPPPARERVSRAAGSSSAAVRAFADAYVNWSATTVAADMRGLAARSVGQARAATALAAAETTSDYELHRDGIANSGRVEAIAALPGSAKRYVVVTREQTTATNTAAYQGLQPAWHVAIATVSQVGPGAWVVSGWQPQS